LINDPIRFIKRHEFGLETTNTKHRNRTQILSLNRTHIDKTSTNCISWFSSCESKENHTILQHRQKISLNLITLNHNLSWLSLFVIIVEHPFTVARVVFVSDDYNGELCLPQSIRRVRILLFPPYTYKHNLSVN